jgi:hypothetical protein
VRDEKGGCGYTIEERGVRILKGNLEEKRSLGYLTVYLEFWVDRPIV